MSRVVELCVTALFLAVGVVLIIAGSLFWVQATLAASARLAHDCCTQVCRAVDCRPSRRRRWSAIYAFFAAPLEPSAAWHIVPSSAAEMGAPAQGVSGRRRDIIAPSPVVRSPGGGSPVAACGGAAKGGPRVPAACSSWLLPVAAGMPCALNCVSRYVAAATYEL